MLTDDVCYMTYAAGGAGGDMLRGMLEKSLADTRLKQASGHTVHWLGQKVSIYIYIYIYIEREREREEESERAREGVYIYREREREREG
jgi:hypothetical protein